MRRALTVILLLSTAVPALQPGDEAEYQLAQSLDRRDLPFSAFYHYARIVQAGPGHPSWAMRA